MNQQLQDFARSTLKDNLRKCTSGQVNIFNRMYSPDDHAKPIDEVVDAMSEEKLDWAMQQVQRTLDK